MHNQWYFVFLLHCRGQAFNIVKDWPNEYNDFRDEFTQEAASNGNEVLAREFLDQYLLASAEGEGYPPPHSVIIPTSYQYHPLLSTITFVNIFTSFSASFFLLSSFLPSSQEHRDFHDFP
jgi:hypothetical protein